MEADDVTACQTRQPTVSRLSRRELLILLGTLGVAATTAAAAAVLPDLAEAPAADALPTYLGQAPRLQASRDDASRLVLWRDVANGDTSAYRLNAAAERLWLRCDGQHASAAIAAEIAAADGVSVASCQACLSQMLTLGLLIGVQEPGAASAGERRLYRLPPRT